MNERINELRLEAGISRLQDEPKFMVAVSKEGKVVEPLDGLQKFAELIVRECAGLCSITASGRDAETIEEAILKHFDVR